MPTPRSPRPRPTLALLVAALAGAPADLHAGGTPENALLLVNPSSANSLFLANYYKNARNIPDANVLYIDPAATDYVSDFAAANGNIDALLGHLRVARTDQTTDYVVVCDPAAFFVAAPARVSDQCFPVGRFSISSAYTLAFQRARILTAVAPSTEFQQYQFLTTGSLSPLAFSTSTFWASGAPTTNATVGRRYFIGALLGYTGPNGNTIPELLAMIDRSVAVDGTRPTGGRVYYVSTDDNLRNVRSPQYPGAASLIPGAAGVVINAAVPPNGSALPTGSQDVQGVMTGAADPPIDTDPFTILPGAFADHLTSYAATFDLNDQTKVSSWIRRGASASAGAVEEPCNYTFKFPFPTIHPLIYAGLSLGEAYLRTMGYVPYQSLLYGDPLTRPFATFPAVAVNAPAGTVSGTIAFTPSASTALAGASVAGLDLLVNGQRALAGVLPGQSMTLNTAALPDGWNELRVLASDSTPVKNVGRAIAAITVNNFGRAVSLSIPTTAGTMTTPLAATIAASGGAVSEIRLLQNNRVIAATTAASGTLNVFGRTLGPGPSRVQAEALFADGRVARSAPVTLNIANAAGSPAGAPPQAVSYTKRVPRAGSIVVELPGVFDDGYANATWTITQGPAQSTFRAFKGYAVLTTPTTASGTDQLRYTVTTPSGTSAQGTVTLRYTPAVRTAVRW